MKTLSPRRRALALLFAFACGLAVAGGAAAQTKILLRISTPAVPDD